MIPANELKIEEPVISRNALIVLNYLKKHSCHIIMRWNYGIQVYKVVKDGKELSYPRINEDTWCEILHRLYGEGDYQKCMVFRLH
jgi:hypothetical protein